MRRLYWLLAAIVTLLVCPPRLIAQNSALSGFCEVGGQTATVQGLSVAPQVQASYPGCTITVYLSGTINPASLFNSVGASISNPFTASTTTGFWTFYVATGTTVDVTISGAGLSSPFTFPALTAGSTGGGGGGNPFVFPGVFTNTQMNDGVTSSVNGLTSIEFHNSGQSGYATEAVSGAISVPVSSTVQNANGTSGYVTNSSTTTAAIGGYFSSRSLANSAVVYGMRGTAVLSSGLSPSVANAIAGTYDLANNSGSDWTAGGPLDGVAITSTGSNKARFGIHVQASTPFPSDYWNTAALFQHFSDFGVQINSGNSGSVAESITPGSDSSSQTEMQGTNNAGNVTVWSIRNNGDIYGNTLNSAGAISGTAISGSTLSLSSYQDLTEVAAPANPASGRERWYANSSTHQLSCLTSTGGNCVPSGGGGSPPASPGAALQLSNAGVTAFTTVSANGTSLGVDSVSAPTVLNVPFSESIAGPRPYVDVTAYGATGVGGAHDDTSAIQAAITFACANGGSVYFPPVPAFYNISQPQNPSTAPVFTICTGLHLLGGNAVLRPAQFEMTPSVPIIVNAPGASPNAAPVFQCVYPACAGGVTFNNLSVLGYNQAVYIDQASNNHFINTTLETYQGQPTGLTDNTPLKICNSTWDWYEGGSIETNNASTIPAILLCSDSVSGLLSQVQLAYFDNIIMNGGYVLYRAGIANSGSSAGNMAFRHITLENNGSNAFLKVTENSAGYVGGMVNVTFDNVILSDGAAVPLVSWNSTTALSGVKIISSDAGASAVQVNSGSVNQVSVETSGAAAANFQVVNGSNNPVGNAMTQNWDGFDYISNTTNAGRLRSDLGNLFNTPTSVGFNGPAGRFTPSGNSYSTLALDPLGVFFGTGTRFGFDTYLGETAQNTVDVNFSETLPPTSVAGTPTTGGSLAAGTYYYYMTSSDTLGICNESAPSLVSAAVVVGAPNDAVTLTWSVPTATGIRTVGYYCVFRSTVAPPGTVTDGTALEQTVTGGGVTTFTDNGGGSGGGIEPPIPTYTAQHRFKSNALGINTTNPQYSLDVHDTNAANAGLSATAGTFTNSVTVGGGSEIFPDHMGVGSSGFLWDLEVVHGSATFKGTYSLAYAFPETSATSVVAGSGYESCYGSSSAHQILCSYSNGNFLPLPLTQVGTCTIGTNCTVTFGTAFTATPVCIGTDQTTAAAVKAVPGTSGVTLTGTGADVIAWACFGNPN